MATTGSRSLSVPRSDSQTVRVDAGIDVFFCDPHAPWQRGSNENTNGLLRQYFPKGTDFSSVTEAQLDAVADELNDRPQTARLRQPHRAARRTAVALTARIRRALTGTNHPTTLTAHLPPGGADVPAQRQGVPSGVPVAARVSRFVRAVIRPRYERWRSSGA
jgi:hypothetical protein